MSVAEMQKLVSGEALLWKGLKLELRPKVLSLTEKWGLPMWYQSVK